jgi:hypothetical protein
MWPCTIHNAEHHATWHRMFILFWEIHIIISTPKKYVQILQLFFAKFSAKFFKAIVMTNQRIFTRLGASDITWLTNNTQMHWASISVDIRHSKMGIDVSTAECCASVQMNVSNWKKLRFLILSTNLSSHHLQPISAPNVAKYCTAELEFAARQGCKMNILLHLQTRPFC